MRIAVLASGSKGNATYIEAGGVRILVDMGVSLRRLTAALADFGASPGDLDAILITHEHSDHVRTLPILLRHCNAPLYTRPQTWDAIAAKCQAERFHPVYDTISLADGAVQVRAFDLPHDAAAPVGYSVRCGNEQCTLATDLGSVTDDLRRELEDADTVILESNHDLAMLRGGSYPWPLKQRILGSHGHLSNADAAEALAQLRHAPARVLLAHLSHVNNTAALAHDTVAARLADVGRYQLPVAVTSQDETISTES